MTDHVSPHPQGDPSAWREELQIWRGHAFDHPWIEALSRQASSLEDATEARAFVQSAEEVAVRIVEAALLTLGLDPSGQPKLTDKISMVVATLESEGNAAFPNRWGWQPRPGLQQMARSLSDLNRLSTEVGSGPSWVAAVKSAATDFINAAGHAMSSMISRPSSASAAEAIPWVTGHAILNTALRVKADPLSAVERILHEFNALVPSPAWAKLEEQDVLSEIETGRQQLAERLSEHPPAIEIDGLWVGLSGNYRQPYYAGGGNYDPENYEWPVEELTWVPADSPLDSIWLSELSECARAHPELGTAADLAAWGYSCVLARELAKWAGVELGLGRMGACAGFDGGDWIHLGWIEAG